MKNVTLDTYSPFHKTGHTSKGDQRKWKVDGIWYKADYMGYEGLAEVLVSSLLGKSSLSYPFVAYQPVQGFSERGRNSDSSGKIVPKIYR